MWRVIPLLMLTACASLGLHDSGVSGTATGAIIAETMTAEELNYLVGPVDNDGKPLPFDPSCASEQKVYYSTANIGAVNFWKTANAAWMMKVQKEFPSTRKHLAPNLSRCVRNPYRLPASTDN